MGKKNCQAFPSGRRIEYFEVSSFGHHRRLDQLEPAQPFDAHIAFIARQQQPHGIAVRRPQPLAVLVERDHRVVHGLGQRHGARHARAVGAFRQQPFGAEIDSGFVQQGGEPDPRPFGAGDEAVDGLRAALDRLLGVEQPAIAGAFQEGDARGHGIARQRLHGEDQRPPHQAMDHQAVRFGIDVGDAGVAALEMQAGGRDHAVEPMQRRAERPGPRRAGEACAGARDLLLEMRGLGVAGKGRAGLPAPIRHRQRLGRGAGQRAEHAGAGDPHQRRAAPEKRPAVDKTIPGRPVEGAGLRRLLHGVSSWGRVAVGDRRALLGRCFPPEMSAIPCPDAGAVERPQTIKESRLALPP
jgi:hypothetical protein